MAYGIKYKCEFDSLKGQQYKVYILKKDYNSAQINMRMGGVPVQINYTSNSENKFEIIRGSECILNIFSDLDGQFTEVMIADAKEYQIQIWKNDTLHWQGYIIQDNYSEPFAASPYLISLRATDGLGDLKLIDFTDGNGAVFLGDMTFAEVILNCLSLLKNGTQLITSNDIFESRIDRNIPQNESFNNLTVSPFMFLENDVKTLKCDEVLKMILELFQCYIYYKNGQYIIERINLKVKEVITRRTYNINFDGINDPTSPIVTTENIRKYISKDGELSLINADQNITYVPGYNKVEIETKIQNPNNLLPNNYFRFWNSDSTLPVSWNKTGNISFAKKEYVRSGTALHIISKVEDNQISYSTNQLIPIRNGFQGSNWARRDDTLTINISNIGNVRLMIKATLNGAIQYLSCARDTSDTSRVSYTTKWEAYPTFCKLPQPSQLKNVDDWFSTKLEIILQVETLKIDIAILPSFNATYTNDCVIRELTANITAGTSARGVGANYSVTSNKNIRETYSDLQPTLGEFGENWYLNQILIKKGTSLLSTANWYRDGKIESKPLFQVASQSILNQYRSSFKLFSGSFFGQFDIGKVCEIQSLTGVYIPFKCSSDLKADLHQIEFFELLNDDDVVSDKYNFYLKYKDGEYTTISNEIVSRQQRSGGRN